MWVVIGMKLEAEMKLNRATKDWEKPKSRILWYMETGKEDFSRPRIFKLPAQTCPFVTTESKCLHWRCQHSTKQAWFFWLHPFQASESYHRQRQFPSRYDATLCLTSMANYFLPTGVNLHVFVQRPFLTFAYAHVLWDTVGVVRCVCVKESTKTDRYHTYLHINMLVLRAQSECAWKFFKRCGVTVHMWVPGLLSVDTFPFSFAFNFINLWTLLGWTLNSFYFN